MINYKLCILLSLILQIVSCNNFQQSNKALSAHEGLILLPHSLNEKHFDSPTIPAQELNIIINDSTLYMHFPEFGLNHLAKILIDEDAMEIDDNRYKFVNNDNLLELVNSHLDTIRYHKIKNVEPFSYDIDSQYVMECMDLKIAIGSGMKINNSVKVPLELSSNGEILHRSFENLNLGGINNEILSCGLFSIFAGTSKDNLFISGYVLDTIIIGGIRFRKFTHDEPNYFRKGLLDQSHYLSPSVINYEIFKDSIPDLDEFVVRSPVVSDLQNYGKFVLSTNEYYHQSILVNSEGEIQYYLNDELIENYETYYIVDEGKAVYLIHEDYERLLYFNDTRDTIRSEFAYRFKVTDGNYQEFIKSEIFLLDTD